MMGFVNQVLHVLVGDTCRDYSQIKRHLKSLHCLFRLVNIVNDVDGKVYRLTCILVLLTGFSGVYIEAIMVARDHQRQTVMNSKDLMKPTAEEISLSKEWSTNFFSLDISNLAFTFSYGGEPSSVLIKNWDSNQSDEQLDEYRRRRSLVFFDSETGLELQCLLTEYTDYPALEWVVSFENKGNDVTPVISNIHVADLTFSAKDPGNFVLHYAAGSQAQITDFQPQTETLMLGQKKRFAPYGGRSSDGILPFFNLEKPDGTGVITGIGWSGQWETSFIIQDKKSVDFKAGMELASLVLYPGEKIRTPAMLLLFYNGDWIRGQNCLRRLLLTHFSPFFSGETTNPPVSASPHSSVSFESTTSANMIEGIKKISDNNLPVDTWWIDAGWYPCPDPKTGKRNWACGVGNWTVDPDRYPDGMKPVADVAHDRGFKFLLWFEPERVMPGTWMHDNHPDWILAPGEFPPEQQYQANDGFHLLDLGNLEALEWLKSKLSSMVDEIGIDVYRHDFNMYPLNYWRQYDSEQQQGLTEIRYITGLYDFLDTLLDNHSNLVIDNCASGGRRIDFEMLRRSLVLWRSDLCWEPVAEQCATYGLSLWIPLHGVGSVSLDPYHFRSGMGSNFSLALNYYDDPSIWEPATKLLNEYMEIKHIFRGDFYPLTPYSTSRKVWIAWQFNRPDVGQGLIQAFRRSENDSTTKKIKLQGLQPDVHYELINFDTDSTLKITGHDLMEGGLELDMENCPGSLTIKYRHLK